MINFTKKGDSNSSDAMLKAAEAEVVRLEAELHETAAWKKLQAAKNVIAVYRAQTPVADAARSGIDFIMASPAPGPTPSPGVTIQVLETKPVQSNLSALAEQFTAKTKAAQVDAAATEFLVARGRRATSGELLPYIQAKGIHLTGQIPAKTLSSYLSTSKKFDNVPAHGGYGLIEWGGSAGPNGKGVKDALGLPWET
ncbi:MAG: hypothetical protein K2X60_08650 [Xanthobacteraceae bacterium]|nr:hypothetical protein [Xanthobacteraceae bacterium]